MDEPEVRNLPCQTADQPHVFADDIETVCALCGAALPARGDPDRPHALRDVPGAVAVCITCALADAAEHKARGGKTTLGVTARTLREAADDLRRKAGDERREADAGRG